MKFDKINLIKDLIAKNEVDSAFDSTKELLTSQKSKGVKSLLEEFIIIKSRYNSLKKSKRIRVITHEEYSIEYNRIKLDLIGLLNEIEKLEDSDKPKILEICQKQVNNTIEQIGNKYDKNLYVKRKIETNIREFIDDKNNRKKCYLIIAPAGSGKTNLFCNLALDYSLTVPTILILGSSCMLTENNDLKEVIKEVIENTDSELQYSSSNKFMNDLTKNSPSNKNPIIFIDAINEFEKPVLMKKALKKFLSNIPNEIKVIISCRDYYWELFKDSYWKSFTYNDFETENSQNHTLFYFSETENEEAQRKYFDFFNIKGRLGNEALSQCRHPLLLRFFCESYKDKNIGNGIIEDIRLKKLFDTYWQKKIESIAEKNIHQGQEIPYKFSFEDTEKYLFKLANYMLSNNTRAVPLSSLREIVGEEDYKNIKSSYSRIRDEYIILEELYVYNKLKKIINISFVYEEFMEYVMAKSIIYNLGEKYKEINEEIIYERINVLTDKYQNFSQILGVVIYLSLMLKEDHDISIWQLLVNKGDEWRMVIIESIKKLNEEDIDSEIIHLLFELLQQDDISLKTKILDVFKIKQFNKKLTLNQINYIGNLIKIENEANYKNPKYTGDSLKLARRAIHILGKLDPKISVPFIVRGFDGMQSDAATTATKTLRNYGGDAVDELINYIKSGNFNGFERSDVVYNSIFITLSRIDSKEVVKFFLNSLWNDSYLKIDFTLEHILSGLQYLTWEPKSNKEKALKLALEFKHKECSDSYPKEALNLFIYLLKYRYVISGFSELCHAILTLNAEKGTKVLIEELASSSHGIKKKIMIIDALGKSKSIVAFDYLIQISSRKLDVRIAIVKAIGNLGFAEGLDYLSKINTKNEWLAFQIKEAIQKIENLNKKDKND